MKILSVNNVKEARYYVRKEQERRDIIMWRSRKALIDIKDMSDEYLENVINFLEEQEELEKTL